jgi:hypothetical protein
VAGIGTRTLPGVTSAPSVDDDHRHMLRAVELAAAVRTTTSPNPWVGCVIVGADGRVAEGATQPPGSPHAEAAALAAGEVGVGQVDALVAHALGVVEEDLLGVVGARRRRPRRLGRRRRAAEARHLRAFGRLAAARARRER